MRAWSREVKKFQWRCRPRTRRRNNERGRKVPPGGIVRRPELAGARWLARMERWTGPDPYALYKSISTLTDREDILIAAILLKAAR